uniref:RxLR effector candidate protein n=1 Tax=Hyaloperonospora arabidopsidis (strain Emoy2) TaxID=559515 RepID=M4B881_HYAAE
MDPDLWKLMVPEYGARNDMGWHNSWDKLLRWIRYVDEYNGTGKEGFGDDAVLDQLEKITSKENLVSLFEWIGQE